MPRHIDATLLKAEFTGNFIDTSYSPEFIKDIIDRQPTADVQEVRHGKWKQAYNNYPQYVCSNCNHLFNNKSFKYCPNCGAKMDRKET